MRKAILASLVLTPVLLHGQANSPAQPKNILESRLVTPTELAEAGEHTSATKSMRVSTGVVPPKLIHSFDIPLQSNSTTHPGPKTVVVGMIVGADGVPSDLKIVQSAGPFVDHGVLAAVSRYRFKPGTVSNEPVAIPLNLEINLVSTVR